MLPSPSFTDITETPLFSPNAATETHTSVKQEFMLSPRRPSVSDLPEESATLRFSVGPRSPLPIRTISCCDVSNDNILALGTDAVLLSRKKTDKKCRDENKWLENWPHRANGETVKRHGTTDESLKEENSGTAATWTVYICDLDRPWRPFAIWDVVGEIILLKFSPCGSFLIVCDAAGFYYLLASKHSALNAWQLLHKGRFPSGHKFIFATWTKTAQNFLYNPTQQANGFFSLAGRPKILAIQDHRHYSERDGFFLVSDKGLITLVYMEKNRQNLLEKTNSETGRKSFGTGNKNSEFFFRTYTGHTGLDTEFVVADTVYDVDENVFYLALASLITPDVFFLKFPLPNCSSAEIPPASNHDVVFENSTTLAGKNSFLRVKLIISSKVKYLLAVTRSSECDLLELWELSTDSQRDFFDALSDPAVVPSDKPAWSMCFTQTLPAVFLTWSLPSDRFITNDIDRSFTVSVAVRDGGIGFYTVKLGLEISITEAGKVDVPRPVQFVRKIGVGLKKVAVTPEAVSLITSANGSLVYMVDTACRIWVFSIPHNLWLVNHIPDLLEILLTVELDFCDVVAAISNANANAMLRMLEDVFHGFSLPQKTKSQVRFTKLKAALLEKIDGKIAAIFLTGSIFLDVFLTFLEQFIDAKNPQHFSSPLLFQIPDLLMALQKEDSSLENICAVVEEHLFLDENFLRKILTGFHLIIGEIIELINLFVRHPNLVVSADAGLTSTPAMDSLLKIRLILALVAVWTFPQKNLRKFCQRPSFDRDQTRTVLHFLFEITVLMRQSNWLQSVTCLLDDAGFPSKNWSKDWKKIYVLSETRASFLTLSASGKAEHLEFEGSFSFLSSHFDDSSSPFDDSSSSFDDGTIGSIVSFGSVGLAEVTATGDPNTDTFNLKPAKRKYCSRCFFNFPWRPVPKECTGTWHSHMRYRWKKCFCGGAWIFL